MQGVLIGGYRGRLLLLGGVVASVLLICCLNLGNLFVVQGIARQREFAIRTALGAGRPQLVRQLATDNEAHAATPATARPATTMPDSRAEPTPACMGSMDSAACDAPAKTSANIF